MPNPSGANQINKQYGDVSKLTKLKKAAPMSGAPMPTNAPQAAQRRAVRGQRPTSAPAPPMAAVPPTAPPYQTELSLVYQELLREMPDDPLVRYYADLAARHAAGA